MRESGPTRLIGYCADYKCAHSMVDASRWGDDIRLSDLEPRFSCEVCGHRGLISGRCSRPCAWGPVRRGPVLVLRAKGYLLTRPSVSDYQRRSAERKQAGGDQGPKRNSNLLGHATPMPSSSVSSNLSRLPSLPRSSAKAARYVTLPRKRIETSRHRIERRIYVATAPALVPPSTSGAGATLVELRMRTSPSMVPSQGGDTYLVLDDLGRFGRVWRETAVKRHPELPPLRHVELPPPSGL
jgi:hypothetical protein